MPRHQRVIFQGQRVKPRHQLRPARRARALGEHGGHHGQPALLPLHARHRAQVVAVHARGVAYVLALAHGLGVAGQAYVARVYLVRPVHAQLHAHIVQGPCGAQLQHEHAVGPRHKRAAAVLAAVVLIAYQRLRARQVQLAPVAPEPAHDRRLNRNVAYREGIARIRVIAALPQRAYQHRVRLRHAPGQYQPPHLGQHVRNIGHLGLTRLAPAAGMAEHYALMRRAPVYQRARKAVAQRQPLAPLAVPPARRLPGYKSVSHTILHAPRCAAHLKIKFTISALFFLFAPLKSANFRNYSAKKVKSRPCASHSGLSYAHSRAGCCP